MSKSPPVALKKPQTFTIHGKEFTDDYDWLREKNHPDVKAYLDAENAYTEVQTQHLGDLQQVISHVEADLG